MCIMCVAVANSHVDETQTFADSLCAGSAGFLASVAGDAGMQRLGGSGRTKENKQCECGS
jgi:hypothetical protein